MREKVEGRKKVSEGCSRSTLRRLSLWILFVLLLVLLGSTSNTVAQPTTFFGEDSGLGEDTRLTSTPNADAARAEFLAQLTNPGTENFESFSDGAVVPLAVDFGAAGTATLQGTGEIEEIPTGTNGYGRYPISGDKYWDTNSSFSIDFTEPQAAFGFYGIDVGDFSGQLTITYEDGFTQTVPISHTVNSPGGTVIYFGFIDTDHPFITLTFGTTTGEDWFGFDDFTIGTIEQVVPTPTPTPSPELVAYYPFDGNARDYSGNGFDGTNHGATFVSGISGQALYFDGTNDYVSAPININPDVMPEITMAAWVRADDDFGTIISHDNGGFDRTIDIDYRGGGTGWSAFSGSGAVLGYHPVTIGQWVFIAAVYNQEASTVKFYVNDALYEETGSLGSGWDYVNIGKNPSFGAYFYGTIDEVRIYNYALSASEIQALYESVSIPPTPTPSPSPPPASAHTPSPTPTPTPTPSPSLSPTPAPSKVGTLRPATLVAMLKPSQSATEMKTYTTAEGKPITRVDVLFEFDLTASMGEELSTMQTESQNIMNSLRAQVPDSAFGVASFMDYPGSFSFEDYSDTYGSSDDYPWKLDRRITTDTDAVRYAINGLELGNGQDYPESYSRALYETYADPSVGWRSGAKKIVIMFGDDIPHDPAYSTGIDPGRDGEVDTVDDLYFEDVVAGLKSNGITVLVLHSGDDRPWRYLVGETGGIYYELTHAEASQIPEAIAGMVEAEVEKIGELTLRAETGYEDWLSFTPDMYTDVGGGETKSFDVTVTVPEGASGSIYEFMIDLVGDGTVLGTQMVTITVPETPTPTPSPPISPPPTLPPSGASHLENCNISIKENGDTIISFSFRLSPREEANWLANRFEIAKSMGIALEKRFKRDADVLKISSRESTFIIPNLIQPIDKTYIMPELDLIELERDFQKATEKATGGQFAAISLVPTTATIDFPDEYAETFVDTIFIPETSHTITGMIKPWIKICRPPSGAKLRNATTIHVRGSGDIKMVSLLIQGVRWEKRLEDNSPPFYFEWNINDSNVSGGSYRIEATGFVGEEGEESITDSIIVDVEKPVVPPATLIAILVACIIAGAAAAGAAASRLRATSSMRGRRGSGILDLKFSFHRSVLAAKYRTSKSGDFLRIALGIGALSLAYTLQCTLPMKTVFFTVPFSTPFSEEGIPLLVPTFGSFASNALSIFFLIIALVGTVILVREVVQHFLAWILDAEVGAIIDKTATILMLGSGVFGHPFGYPLRSIIWEDLSPRVKGFICLGNIMSLFSLLAFFYYLSGVCEAKWVIWVAGVGIPAVAMSLVYSLIPFVGEEGTVIFEWNKLLAIILFVIAGFTYLSLTLNLFDPLTLQFSVGMISLGGSGILIGGLLLYKFMGWINLI